MNQHRFAFIIARSAQLRDSLEILLHSIPGIEVVCKVSDLSEVFVNCSGSETALIVYEFEKESDGIQKLEALKNALPGPQVIVLVEDGSECQQVEPIGVTCLPNGTLAARLAEVIEGLVIPA